MAAVAFLRAINVGGRRITNEDLSAAFRTLGFPHALPYQTSGNVILPSASAESATARRIEAGLQAELGYRVPTFLRSASEIHSLATRSPYLGRAGTTGGKPQLIFLEDPVSDHAALEALRPPEDHWTAIGTEIHWLPSAGLSQSELNLKELERLVGPHTVRTLGTIERIAKKLI